MPMAENRDICRRFFEEVVSLGDLSVVDGICASDYRLHATLSRPEAARTRCGSRRLHRSG